MDTYFARLRTEDEALDADEVAQVEQAFEHRVVQFLVLTRTDVVARHVNLDAPFRVLELHEARLAHDAAAHHAPRDAHLAGLRRIVGEFVFYVDRESIRGVSRGGIRVDAHRPEFLQRFTAVDFLFAKFENVHFVVLSVLLAKVRFFSEAGNIPPPLAAESPPRARRIPVRGPARARSHTRRSHGPDAFLPSRPANPVSRPEISVSRLVFPVSRPVFRATPPAAGGRRASRCGTPSGAAGRHIIIRRLATLAKTS